MINFKVAFPVVFLFLTSCSVSDSLFVESSPTDGRSSMGLLDVQYESHSQVRNLSDGQWSTVFSKSWTCAAGDFGLVTGSTQVTTEDNEVIYSARIVVDQNVAGVVASHTAKQPDDTGGNHHLPIYAMAAVTCASNQTYQVQFQVKAQIVSRKRGEIFVDPPTGADQSAGALVIERYGLGQNPYGLVEARRFSWTSGGASTACCKQMAYIPMINFSLRPQQGDLLNLVQTLIVRHDRATRSRGFDGEQVASVFTLSNKPISPYQGQNTTSRNPVLGMFNQAFVTHQGSDTSYALNIGGNFGRGAIIDGTLSTLQSLVWRKGAGQFFRALYSENLPNVGTTNSPQTVKSFAIPAQVGDTVKIDVIAPFHSQASDSTECRLDLNNSENSQAVIVALGQGYQYATARTAMTVKVGSNAGLQLRVLASCNRATQLNGGQLFVTVFR